MAAFDFPERIDRVLRALFLLGVWRDIGQVQDAIYFAAIVVTFNLNIIAQIINLVFVFDDMEMATLSILVILTDLFTNVKIYFFAKYKRIIVHLRDTVRRQSFQPKNRTQEEMTKHTFKVFDYMYFAFRFFPTLTILVWGLYPLVQERELRRLPFLAWYPFDVSNHLWLYVAVFFHQMLSQMLVAHIHVHLDSLNFTFLAVIITQFDILSDDLKNLFASKGGVYRIGSEKYCGPRDAETAALVDCVNHHREIILFSQEVYKMLNMSVFGQFMLSTGALCLTLLQLSIAEIDVQFFAIVFFVCSFLAQLSLYCWWGNEVMLKSENLPLAAFESNWLDLPNPLKKDVAFLLHRTQTPMVIYAIDFFKVNLQSFVMILRHSYSAYTVLRRADNS